MSQQIKSTTSIIPDEKWRTAIFDYSPVPTAVVDLVGGFVEVNNAYCAVTGYARAELLERTWQSITHPDDIAGDQAGSDDLIAKRSSFYQCDKRYIRKFGGSVLGTLNVHVVRNDDGQPICFWVVFLPIVEGAERVRYDPNDRRAIYETKQTKPSLMEWAIRNPGAAVAGGLGLAFLLGAERIASIIERFFP